MSKRAIIALIIVIICLAGATAVYFLWQKKSGITIEKIIEKGLTDKLKKEEYLILYEKTSNDVYQNIQIKGDLKCNQFLLHEILGGGIVKRDGTENENLDIQGYPVGSPESKRYNNYYYISASSSPVVEMGRGMFGFDFDFDDQILWSADFKAGESHEIKSSTPDKFPGEIAVSSENRYLIYVMTNKKEKKFQGAMIDPFLSDSDLIIRDTRTGKEQTILTGNYNRQLFHSFSDFSYIEDAFYTIVRDGESFKFIKIMLDSGRVIDFNEAFPEFDWSKINWDDFFKKEVEYSPAEFFLSPDETKILVYRNKTELTLEDYCLPTCSYKLWSINIKENNIDTYLEESKFVSGLIWEKDSQEFALALTTKGGCAPDYLDSTIVKMDRDGKNREDLVLEKKSRINNLGWSPDGKEIIYSVYGTDFVSWLKSVDPETKVVKEVISTKDTEGSINKERPVVFIFVDWVLK